ncbi:Uncharacterised protein [Mycobacteroides abscessus subsp. abscessus]|nr:Uncharacterised protein [Mycobacteroides abscessus subsp. abscessus]
MRLRAPLTTSGSVSTTSATASCTSDETALPRRSSRPAALVADFARPKLSPAVPRDTSIGARAASLSPRARR